MRRGVAGPALKCFSPRVTPALIRRAGAAPSFQSCQSPTGARNWPGGCAQRWTQSKRSPSGRKRSLLKTRRRGEPQIAGRGAQFNRVIARDDAPSMLCLVEMREEARVCGDADALALAGGEGDLAPAHEASRPPAIRLRRAHIDLRNIGTRPLATICHSEAYGDCLAPADAEIAVAEAGIGKPEAEGIERRRVLLLEPFVSDR